MPFLLLEKESRNLEAPQDSKILEFQMDPFSIPESP